MPLPLLLAALPGAIKLGSDYLNRPRESDFTPNLDYQKRYIADLKGRSARSEVSRAAVQPVAKAINQESRKIGRNIQSAVAKGDLSSAEEAQLNITAGQNAVGALQEVGEKAFISQANENRRLGERIDQTYADIDRVKTEARQRFEQAQQQYKSQLVGDALNIAGSVASAGITQYLGNKEAANKAYQLALGKGLTTAGSVDEFVKQGADAGINDPSTFGTNLETMAGLKKEITDKYPGAEGKLGDLKTAQEFKDEYTKYKKQNETTFLNLKSDPTKLTEAGIVDNRDLTFDQKKVLMKDYLAAKPEEEKTISEFSTNVLLASVDPETTPEAYNGLLEQVETQEEYNHWKDGYTKLNKRVNDKREALIKATTYTDPQKKQVSALNALRIETQAQFKTAAQAFAGGDMPSGEGLEFIFDAADLESLSSGDLSLATEAVNKWVDGLDLSEDPPETYGDLQIFIGEAKTPEDRARKLKNSLNGMLADISAKSIDPGKTAFARYNQQAQAATQALGDIADPQAALAAIPTSTKGPDDGVPTSPPAYNQATDDPLNKFGATGPQKATPEEFTAKPLKIDFTSDTDPLEQVIAEPFDARKIKAMSRTSRIALKQAMFEKEGVDMPATAIFAPWTDDEIAMIRDLWYEPRKNANKGQ